MNLDSFIQNEKAKRTLLDMVQKKRINHAVLLAGPRGVGKKSFARMMAAAFLCENETPCFACPSCRKALGGAHADITEITEHIKPRSFSVDEVRRIRREAYISPNESKYRIFILANIESMSVEAQNSLLKIIEEPPKHAVFILTAQDTGALLPTVLSRVITVPINPVTEDALEGYLQKSFPDKKIDTASALSQGSIGRAMEIIENDTLKKTADAAIEIVKSAAKGDRYETLRLLTKTAQSSEIAQTLDFMAAILENAMCRKTDPISREIACSGRRVVKMLEAVISAKKSIAFNVNKTLLMTHLCVKMYE